MTKETTPARRRATTLPRERVQDLVTKHFPQVYANGERLTIEAVSKGRAEVRLHADENMLRPGGTVSGPSMFKLADFAIYVAILGELGEDGLQAVTTSMTVNFLRRPELGDVTAKVHLIKLGRRLAVAEVELYSEGQEEIIAHAVGTYSIPAPGQPLRLGGGAAV